MKRQQTIHQSYLLQLEFELEEIKGISGRPCWIYTAYQMHRLYCGINQLQSLKHFQYEEQKKVKTLLNKYQHTLNAITN